MEKKLNLMYLSLFSISDMALNYKVDPTYTQSIIETILCFALCDELIDSHQYEEMAKLLAEDLEGFHSYMFKHVDFD